MKKLSFTMLAVVILVMMAATVIENIYGTATSIYGAWWFAALWALLAVSAMVYVFRQKMQRRPALLLLHLSFAVILAGSLITHICGRQGTLHLREGQEVILFLDEDGTIEHLPFSLMLKKFTIATYPGTQTPMDYISEVMTGDQKLMTISMNHIGQLSGYRFYQSDYDADLHGSVLAVSYDPWGIGVTYVGYGLLFLSMTLLLLLPNEGFRKALRRLAVTLACGMLSFTSLASEPKVLPDSLAARWCDLHVFYNGRVCPLQTVAYDFTAKLYGKTSYHGYNAEQVFTGWLFYPSTWKVLPRKERKGARYAEEQDAIVQMLESGQFMRIFPYRGDWYGPGDELPEEIDEETGLFIRNSLGFAGKEAEMEQYGLLWISAEMIGRYQKQEAGEGLPSESRFCAEKLYNRTHATRPLAMALATLGILLYLFYVMRWIKGQNIPHLVHGFAMGASALSALYLLFVLGLRCFVSGHLPLSNGHETMQFLAWLTLLLTFVLQRRFVLAMPLGLLLAGLTLLVSMMSESNPQITPLMPVLSSPLLSIHVCVIMLAYSLLAFIFLNGLTALILSLGNSKEQEGEGRISKMQEQLYSVSHMLLYPALFCMAAGIFIGAIWANVSWGRYWGWDPKEVWALITLLLYSFALHGQSLPFFRRPMHFHLFMVIAFLSVLMTYFGVNFILGGMHSYANG